MNTERKKVALVTGASSGIGYALTDELAGRGFTVYAAARRTAPMKPLVDKHGSSSVIPVQLDVTNEDQIVELRERFTKELPESKLDLLYNNAGQACGVPAVDATTEKIRRCFDVNVIGPMSVTRELAPFVINAKGAIVFTGSVIGMLPFPFFSIYGASKAAIHQYATNLHLEMKPLGVKVLNAVTGGVQTAIQDTDPLPDSSIFNTPEGQIAFKEMATQSSTQTLMQPNVYAKMLVDDALSKQDQVTVYRGTAASLMGWVSRWLPTWIVEMLAIRQYKLAPAYAAIAKNLAGSNKDIKQA